MLGAESSRIWRRIRWVLSARLANVAEVTRPSVRVTRGAGSGQHLASFLQEGRENANIDAGLGFIWRISDYTSSWGDGLCKMFMKRRRDVSGGHFAFGE
jgi:hypothetical protein